MGSSQCVGGTHARRIRGLIIRIVVNDVCSSPTPDITPEQSKVFIVKTDGIVSGNSEFCANGRIQFWQGVLPDGTQFRDGGAESVEFKPAPPPRMSLTGTEKENRRRQTSQMEQ